MKRPIFFLFCLLVLVVTATADESAQRKKLVECLNGELDKENAEYKLKSDELKILKEIVDKLVMKEPLKSHSEDEQGKILKEIEEGAKKDLPKVKTETVDRMMIKLKESAMHCCLLLDA